MYQETVNEKSAQFRDLLGTDESLVAVASGTLLDRSEEGRVSIGLTDRRLVTVSEDDGFLDVGYESIHSIRSRPRRTLTYRGVDYRGLAVVGGLLVVAALAGILSLDADAGPGVVAFLTIAGLVPLLYVRRDAVDGGSLGASAHDWLAATVDDDERLRRYERRVGRHVESDRSLVAASVLVEIVALAGLLVVTASVLAPLLGLVAVGGVAVVDYAVRYRETFDGFDVERREQCEVGVHLSDGRTVRLRLDADTSIDRHLSRLVNGRAVTGRASETVEVPVEPP